MNSGQLLRSRLADQTARTGVVIAGPLELSQDRLEALGSFRVPGRDLVFEHPRVREKSDDHGSSSGTGERVVFDAMAFEFRGSYQIVRIEERPDRHGGRGSTWNRRRAGALGLTGLMAAG
jgi:hypothetical protein